MRAIAVAMLVLAALSTRVDAAGSAQVDAARSRGLAWMLTHQRADGSWRGAAGSEFVATATALEALGVSGVKTYPYAAGVAWLGNAHPASVDSLARQVIAMSAAGLDATSSAETLRAWRNATLGWGAYARYDTTFPDTALALAGLRLAQRAAPDAEIEAALCLVANAQNAGDASVHGSWSYVSAAGAAPASRTGAIVPTVYNLLELDATARARGWTSLGSCGGATYGVATIVDAALAWLLTTRRNADGGFGDAGVSRELETALVYRALSALRPNEPATAAALDFLLARQRQDGSWGADVLHTAMVLAALPPPAAALADSDHDGVPDAVETMLPTDPNVADSRWLARGRTARQTPAPGVANDFGLVASGGRTPDAAMNASPRDGWLSSAPAAARGSTTVRVDPRTLGVPLDRFGVDPFTGVARAELSLVVPPGAGGIAPSLALRYDSGAVDEAGRDVPAAMTGLGWTLDLGPVIVRDARNTTATTDDTFALVRDGARHDLVLVDTAAALYRTRDDTFVRLVHDAGADAWTVTTKDGTVWRLGSTAASRLRGLGPDLVTPHTRAYHVDELRTPSGVAVRYAYTKQTAALANGQSYDQAIYPATVTWAYRDDAVIGTRREAAFAYGDRSDSPGSRRLESVTVRAGSAVARTYVFAYDDSIDRAGAGDLTLRALTVVGGDGVTVSPVAAFTYTPSGRLATARNALGGTVRYGYERVTTTPLYSVCSGEACADRGICDDPDPWGRSVLIGHLMTAPGVDLVPIYSICRVGGRENCGDWSLGTTPDSTNPLPLGYAPSPTLPSVGGALPLHRNCDDGNCLASTAPNSGELLGYVYAGALDRHRVVARALDDGRGVVGTTAYAYTDPTFDAAGRFRGFASVRETDPASTTTDTWFHDTDRLAGRAYRTQVRAADGALQRDVTHDWVAAPTAGAAAAAFLTRTQVAACDGGATCRTSAEVFEYDTDGNRTRVYSLGDVAVAGDERDERTDWVVDAVAGIHRPSRIALQDASGAVVRERWLAYDGLAWGSVGTRGVLTREERRLAGALGAEGNAVTTQAWDVYGNRVAVSDAAGCTTTTAFDDDRTHPVATTTCLGQTTTVAYDAATAVPRSDTDANGATTTYAYDGLGRLTRVTGPLDTASTFGSTTWEYLDLGDAAMQRVVTYRTHEHGTALTRWLEDAFDGQGRVYRHRAEAPGGQAIVTERVFDTRGLVTQESAPYAGGEEPAWTRSTHDGLGRVTQVAYPDDRRVTTTYTPGVETTTDARGAVRRRYVGVDGRVARIEESGGGQTLTAVYARNAAGDLIGITDSVGRAWDLRRDAVGRLTELTTPNRGPVRYRYDARGSLLERTDAAGRTVTYAYDLAGRLTARRYPDGRRIEWIYDEPSALAPYTIGRLTRVNDLATSTTFTYDAAGRIVRTSRVLDGSTYVTSYAYDALGNVTSRTFPDGETVTFQYDAAGRLAAVPGYVTAIAYNPRGQRTRIELANGATTTLAYYDGAAERRNLRLKSVVTSSGGARVQALGFTYDDAGNLVRIVDTVGTAGRTLTYDALGRLSGAREWPGGAFEEYRYDVTGNLTVRGGTVYAYADGAHPSAVSATSDGREFVYDVDGAASRAGSLTLAWDVDHRLRTVSSAAAGAVTYDYDAEGRRVRRTTSAGVARIPFPDYAIDPFGVVIKRLGPVARTSTGDVTYQHVDHLDRTHAVTDARGALRRLVEYGAWGDVTRVDGAHDDADRWTDAVVPGARVYDPGLGRYLDAGAVVPGVRSPQALNEYSYALNDPMAPAVLEVPDP